MPTTYLRLTRKIYSTHGCFKFGVIISLAHSTRLTVYVNPPVPRSPFMCVVACPLCKGALRASVAARKWSVAAIILGVFSTLLKAGLYFMLDLKCDYFCFKSS